MPRAFSLMATSSFQSTPRSCRRLTCCSVRSMRFSRISVVSLFFSRHFLARDLGPRALVGNHEVGLGERLAGAPAGGDAGDGLRRGAPGARRSGPGSC